MSSPGSGSSSHDDALPSQPVEHFVAPPAPPADGLSPLQRVDMLLPSPVGRATRLAVGAQAFLRRIGWPESRVADATSFGGVSSVTSSAYDGTDTVAALHRWAESVTERATGAAPPEAMRDRRLNALPRRDLDADLWSPPDEQPDRQQGRQFSAEESATSAASPEAAEEYRWGSARLLPADLTIASRPTRMESARRLWRELNYLTQLDARVTGPRLLRCVTVAVVSPKGGVGKTTVTALLGTLFALLRRDPTVAVDTNPDFGSLGRVLTPDQSWYVDDLARLVAEDNELSLTALESHLGRAIHGLLVVPAPTDPERMAALDEGAYRQLIARLKDYFSLILLDCGTGLQDPASAAAIAAADQVLLVTDALPASASLVVESTGLLHQWGRPITVVVNRMPVKGGKLDLERLSHYLPTARGLIVIPDDMFAATKLAVGSFDWRDAPASWQGAVRRLAAVLVADWPRLGLAR